MACLLDINEEQLNPQYLGIQIMKWFFKWIRSFLGQNQILIDRHGHTLIEKSNSHHLSDTHTLNEKQINEYAQKLIALGQ